MSASRWPRRALHFFAGLALAALAAGCSPPSTHAPTVASQPEGAASTNVLVTGRAITPAGTASGSVGGMPLNIVLSPDGRHAITTSSSLEANLCSLRTSDGAVLSSVNYPTMDASRPNDGLFYGLVHAPDGTLYAAQGARGTIAVLDLSREGVLTQQRTLTCPSGDSPTGLALDARKILYYTNYTPTNPSQATSSVVLYDTAAEAVVGRFTFRDSHGGTPNYPLAVTVRTDGSRAYVASQRDGCVYVLDTADPTNPTLVTSVASGAHPAAVLLNAAQDRLYVANAQSDSVSVVDTASDQVLSTVLLRPTNVRNLPGVSPTGLALSSDEKRLYVSLGDFNAVAVVDEPSHQLAGFIPVGWYPTAVAATPDDKALLVVNGWGTDPRTPNPQFDYLDPDVMAIDYGPTPTYVNSPGPGYALNAIPGNVSRVDLGAALTALPQSTVQVVDNNQNASTADRAAEQALAALGVQAGKIEHVIYVIKENRSYDQVFGDLGVGNGMPSLTLFGWQVTPNQHALARRFIVLDNFYNNAPVSGEGWTWCTQGQANEFVIKTIPYLYRLAPATYSYNYNFEGQNNNYITAGFPAKDPDGNPLSVAWPDGMPAIPNIAESPGGYIWDAVKAAGLTYRNYGFFYSSGVAAPAPSPAPGASPSRAGWIIPDNYPSVTNLQPPGHDLAGVSDYDFRRFDFTYADSDAWVEHGGPFNPTNLAKYGKYGMPSRFAEWNREFQMMLAKDPSGGAVPTFMTVRFMRNHTMGLTPGSDSPRSMVADNDYAVGQLVEAVSRSPIWSKTAIFVIEDDAQFGPDHVDAHRSPCLVISPWIQEGTVDSRFYNTDSVLKTMELLLGLAPMSQYDAFASPILGGWSTAPVNVRPYEALLPQKSIIAEVNPPLSALGPKDPRRRLAEQSLQMNFQVADSAPVRLLNEITWKSVKGPQARMPEPRIVRLSSLDERYGSAEEDDD